MKEKLRAILLEYDDSELPIDTRGNRLATSNDQGKVIMDDADKLLDKAITEEEQQNVVKEYLIQKYDFTDEDLERIKNIIPSLTVSATEVGLDSRKLPLLDFVNNYFKVKHPEATMDIRDYAKVHNLYAKGKVDEDAIAGTTDDKLDALIYNDKFYDLDEDDCYDIADVYYNEFSPENVRDRLKVGDYEKKHIGDTTFTGKELKTDINKLKEVRDKIVFADDGKGTKIPRKYVDIKDALKILFNDKKKESVLEKVANIIKEEKVLDEAGRKKAKKVIAIAILKTFPTEFTENQVKEVRDTFDLLDDKDYEEFGKNKNVINTVDLLKRNQHIINDTNCDQAMDELLDKHTKYDADNSEKTDKENSKKTKEASQGKKRVSRAENTAKKLAYLQNWCKDRINNTKSRKDNVYKYMIWALSDAAIKNSSPVSAKKDAIDTELYNKHVAPNIKNLDANSDRLSFFKNSELVSEKNINRDVVRRLIQYLDDTYRSI